MRWTVVFVVVAMLLSLPPELLETSEKRRAAEQPASCEGSASGGTMRAALVQRWRQVQMDFDRGQ